MLCRQLGLALLFIGILLAMVRVICSRVFAELTSWLDVAQSLTWPEYRDGRERNVVFDVNVTGLAYSEPDTFRQRQIAYIIDNLY